MEFTDDKGQRSPRQEVKLGFIPGSATPAWDATQLSVPFLYNSVKSFLLKAKLGIELIKNSG